MSHTKVSFFSVEKEPVDKNVGLHSKKQSCPLNNLGNAQPIKNKWQLPSCNWKTFVFHIFLENALRNCFKWTPCISHYEYQQSMVPFIPELKKLCKKQKLEGLEHIKVDTGLVLVHKSTNSYETSISSSKIRKKSCSCSLRNWLIISSHVGRYFTNIIYLNKKSQTYKTTRHFSATM